MSRVFVRRDLPATALNMLRNAAGAENVDVFPEDRVIERRGVYRHGPRTGGG